MSIFKSLDAQPHMSHSDDYPPLAFKLMILMGLDEWPMHLEINEKCQ